MDWHEKMGKNSHFSSPNFCQKFPTSQNIFGYHPSPEMLSRTYATVTHQTRKFEMTSPNFTPMLAPQRHN